MPVRQVSNRRFDQAEDAVASQLDHRVKLKALRDEAKMLKDIQEELEKNREKIPKAHELVVESDMCLPVVAKKVAEQKFSDEYKFLYKVPKMYLGEWLIPALMPDLAEDDLTVFKRKSSTVLHEMMYFGLVTHPKAAFGPRTYSKFLEVYQKRAAEKGDLLHKLPIVKGKIDWEADGLYSLHPRPDPEASHEDLKVHRYETIRCLHIEASLDDLVGCVTPLWRITDNFNWKAAQLVSPSGKMPTFCYQFFSDVEEFKAFTRSEYGDDDDDDDNGHL